MSLCGTDLLNRVAELLHRRVSVKVQTGALGALDALARYRAKIQEFRSAVIAGVNHGNLMSLFRKAVLAIANAESSLPNNFVGALLPFLIYIASHSVGRNMVVGAGLIPFSLHNTNQSSLRIKRLH